MAGHAYEVRLESDTFSCAHVEVYRAVGRETISRLFRFEIDVVCLEAANLDPSEVVGAEADLVFREQDGGPEIRRFHGKIEGVLERSETETPYRTFRLALVPRAADMGLVETQEVFLDMSVPDIIKEKADRVGLDTSFRLMATYPKRQFVVQYRESDLAFVSRLAEHLGISFYFLVKDGRDQLVFTDSEDGFSVPEAGGSVAFRGAGDRRDVYSLHVETRLVPRTSVLQDYNYRTPTVDLTSSSESSSPLTTGFVVEYGAHHKTPEDGASLAKVRSDEREARRRVFVGQSDLAQLGAGLHVEVDNHPHHPGQKLLLVEVEHLATQPVLGFGGESTVRDYKNTFRAVPAGFAYRPPRETPRPRIHGLVHGIVQKAPTDGSLEDYAQIDDKGRYWVRIFSDTAFQDGGLGSLPMRMAQPHVGANYGMHFPLKPGVEVVVGFIEGDPDRPILMSAVYNETTPNPVRDTNHIIHKLKTASGAIIEISDGPDPTLWPK